MNIAFPVFVREKDSGDIHCFDSREQMQRQLKRIDVENRGFDWPPEQRHGRDLAASSGWTQQSAWKTRRDLPGVAGGGVADERERNGSGDRYTTPRPPSSVGAAFSAAPIGMVHRTGPPAQASKCLQRCCLPECLVQKKTATHFEALVGALLAASPG
jgi:hypothetical protein